MVVVGLNGSKMTDYFWFLRPSEQAAKPSGAMNSKFEIMAISSYMDRENYQKRIDNLLNAVSSRHI